MKNNFNFGPNQGPGGNNSNPGQGSFGPGGFNPNQGQGPMGGYDGQGGFGQGGYGQGGNSNPNGPGGYGGFGGPGSQPNYYNLDKGGIPAKSGVSEESNPYGFR